MIVQHRIVLTASIVKSLQPLQLDYDLAGFQNQNIIRPALVSQIHSKLITIEQCATKPNALSVPSPTFQQSKREISDKNPIASLPKPATAYNRPQLNQNRVACPDDGGQALRWCSIVRQQEANSKDTSCRSNLGYHFPCSQTQDKSLCKSSRR